MSGGKPPFISLVCVSASAQCSLTCGSGVRRRNITCSRNTGLDCDPQKKPPAVSACSVRACPQEADPFGRDGSGSGWPSDDLLNEINSIPAMKPALRYGGGSRAQPTPVADFHHHNSIEDVRRSPEGSVQVDDFYYDYNFINFHEDLSDGLDSDGNGAEDAVGAPQDVEPTQTAPNVTVETLEMEEVAPTKLAPTKLEPTEDAGKASAENSEGLEDLLSEDYLLPVATTRPPPVQHSQAQTERNERFGRPARDESPPEAESGPRSPADNVHMSATHPGYQTTISALPSKPTTTPAGHDGVYGHHKESTLIPEHQERVQLEQRASQTPQTPSQSFVFPSGFRLEDLAPDPSDFRTETTGRYSREPGFNPTSACEGATPTSLPFLQTSGNQQASVSSTSSGIGTEPPPDLEGATQPSPADLLPAARTYDPTEPPFSEEGGAQLSPQAPWLHEAAPDEALTSTTDRSGRSERPPGTTAAPEKITAEAPHRSPPTSPHSAVLGPLLPPTSVQATASAQVPLPGYWITGNWSAVSPSLTIDFLRILLSSDI